MSALESFILVFRITCSEANSYICVPQLVNPAGCMVTYMLVVFVIHYVKFLGYLTHSVPKSTMVDLIIKLINLINRP
jgi:hypothetical protein